LRLEVFWQERKGQRQGGGHGRVPALRQQDLRAKVGHQPLYWQRSQVESAAVIGTGAFFR
jgi:hypothetical protein